MAEDNLTEKRERGRERMRRWRQENPELDRQRTRRYVEANKDRLAARRKVRGRPLGEVFADWSRTQIEERFRAKIDENGPIPSRCPELGPCHVWTGDRTGHGYGLLRRVGAHRVAMWLDTGEEPGERHVLHHCDNPPCVRRSHLRYGTPADNTADKVARDRVARNIKLSAAEVTAIRARYAAGEKMADLIIEYRISQQQGARIVSGRTRNLAPVETEWRAKGLGSSRQKLTVAQRAEIRRRRSAGESPTVLAIEFGVGPAYVSELANGRVRDRSKTGTRRTRPPLTADQVRRLRQRWEQGDITKAQLAREFDIDPAVVSRTLSGLTYGDVA